MVGSSGSRSRTCSNTSGPRSGGGGEVLGKPAPDRARRARWEDTPCSKREDWASPKRRLDRDELAAYRRRPLDAEENRALRACAAFEGDVLVIESERDDVVPHPAIANYLAAFGKAHFLTYRVIAGADHALSERAWQQAYTALLVAWATKMVLGAREGDAPHGAQARSGPAPLRRPAPDPG